jgi:hypothetical protein
MTARQEKTRVISVFNKPNLSYYSIISSKLVREGVTLDVEQDKGQQNKIF